VTEVLKGYIFKGFTINKERIAVNYKSFLKAIEDVKALLPESGLMCPVIPGMGVQPRPEFTVWFVFDLSE